MSSSLESQSSTFAKYGQTTGDAAAGMVELAKSGLSAQKSLSAIRGTMLLAKAGELEVADASELVANTLNTFGLKASKAASIANSLANAANISSSDVTDLAESFKYVAPLAAKAGLSVEQTSALLAELSNSGIKASQAGTSVRGMLLALQAPSTAGGMWLDELGVQVYGAGGKMRDFGSILEDLRTGIKKVSDEDANFALKSIFGKNSITAASVAIKGGKKSLDEYTKGVQRAGAAEKLATSSTKGLAGTLASMKASATSTAQELYRRFSPALDNRLQSVATYLADNKDEMIAAGIAAGQKLAPALQSLGDLAKSAGPALLDVGEAAAKVLVPALKVAADVLTTVVDAFNALPGPVKSVAVQAGIAALVFPRLAAGITMATTSMKNGIIYTRVLAAEMQTTATRGKLVAATMAKLGGAARGAAGVGGMVALAQSSQAASREMKVLGGAAGGALLGFSLGGPIGGAVGALGGALWGLTEAQKAAREQFKSSLVYQQNYRDSLDQTTAALTEQTKAIAYQNLQANDTLTVTRSLGIADRDAVGYLLGRKAAIERVNTAVGKATGTAKQLRGANSEAFYFNRQSAGDFLNALRLGKAALTDEQKELLRQISATKTWGQVLKGIPKKAQTKIALLGAKASAKDIARLAQKYHLTPKQVRTVIKAVGFEGTRKQIDDVRKRIQNLKAAKPDMSPALRSVTQFSLNAKRQALVGANGISENLKKGTGKAKADLGPFQRSLTSGIATGKSTASSGGSQVGNALGQGMYNGVNGWASAIAGRAAAIVRAAVAAARSAGKIHSPSQEMRDKVGKPLAEGLILGLIQGVKKGTDGVKASLDRLMGVIADRLDGKKLAGRRKALLKSLKDERAELIANGKAQDDNTRKLDKALQKYKSLTQAANQYAAGIKSGIVGFGSVVGLGTTGGGTSISLEAMLSQLTARASVADQFAAVIEKLRGKLNKTSLKQLLDAAAAGDLEGALASAQAIAGGGSAAIAQINQLTAQITQTGAKLGNKMRKQFFGAGLQAAEGLVRGLKKKQRDLDKVAERLANSLVKQVKKALGIKSPSRVFADIGKRSIQGLELGLDQTYVRRVGTRAAAALTTGFGTPALDAYMSSASGAAGAGTTVNITVNVPMGADPVQTGKDVVKAVDSYFSAGGRTRTKWASR